MALPHDQQRLEDLKKLLSELREKQIAFELNLVQTSSPPQKFELKKNIEAIKLEICNYEKEQAELEAKENSGNSKPVPPPPPPPVLPLKKINWLFLATTVSIAVSIVALIVIGLKWKDLSQTTTTTPAREVPCTEVNVVKPPPPPSQLPPPPSFISPSTGMKFMEIPAGKFWMGSPADEAGRNTNEGPQHCVTISQPFYLGQYEVTQGEWQAVMGYNPSYFKGDKNLPVENVSWEEVKKFIENLNMKETGQTEGTYRLPTEAEWEYACRAGSPGKYCFGNDEEKLENYAWYGYKRIKEKTYPVDQKKPNNWWLCDMHGNVWEWCSDWYDNGYYTKSPDKDPKGSDGGSVRVNRGGGWQNDAAGCRSAIRGTRAPNEHDGTLGFRLVREVQ